jgi:dihydroorotate dehydrogenase
MNIYSTFIRKLLFHLPPETAHYLALTTLKLAHQLNLIKPSLITTTPQTIMGLSFPNPIGLAAGLDKNGDYIDALASLGFGFIEIGTVTPKPQSGNPQPRLFRLPKQSALINCMGFNNKGVDYLVERLKQKKAAGIIGVNIGKNRDTPITSAADDYVFCFQRVAPYASYITINISSPNTENLRTLQQSDHLNHLLAILKSEQAIFFQTTKKYVPLVVKISPDLTSTELEEISQVLLANKIDGVIATNTTLNTSPAGGLSGRPLAQLSTEIIYNLSKQLNNKIPIIGCGGIFSMKDMHDKLSAGASLIQLYTGLVYEGIGLIKKLKS